MNGGILDTDPVAIERLNRLLLDNGEFRIRYADDILEHGLENVRGWCVANGRYLLPTWELRSWLEDRLGEWFSGPHWSRVLEIGAGCGDLGLNMGLRTTDSGFQLSPMMRSFYAALGQTITKPGKGVEIIDGIAAAKKYKPHTILAAYVTQKWQLGDSHEEGTGRMVGSCVGGVDERHLLNLCKRYVFIGNEKVHGDKRILSEPHATYRVPGLITRALEPDANVVWVWER